MTNDRPAELTGHEMIGDHNDKIGTVTDVFFDETVTHPKWAAVHTGVLGGDHLVPLTDAYQSEDGMVVVPFDKNTVKHAPKLHKDHVLTPELEQELLQYYDVASSGSGSSGTDPGF